MAAVWRVRMLGGLSADGLGQTVSRFHTQQAAGALAHLAYHLGQPQPREVLVEMLWPGVAPTKGRARLNVAISSLRQQFEPDDEARGSVIQGDRHHLLLSPETVTTDVAEFRAAASAARLATDADRARPLLESALALYAGNLLPGFYQDWVAAEQELLADLLVNVAHRLVALEIARKRPAVALEVAQRAVAVDPLREECHALVLRAAAAMGDRALAQRHYQSVVGLFRAELGGAPSAALRELARAVDGVADRPEHGQPAALDAPTATSQGNTTFLGVRGRPRQSLTELGQSYRGTLADERDDGAVLSFAAARDAWQCALALLAEPVTLGLTTCDVANRREREQAAAQAERMAGAAHGGLVLADLGSVALLRGDDGCAAHFHEQGRYRLVPGCRPELLFWLSEAPRPTESYPMPRAEPAAESRVPRVLTGFYGRDADVAAVTDLLGHAPCLVTVTGAGGAGKTRLALEVAREWIARRGMPCWFVPLAALRDPALLPRAILGAVVGDQADDADPLGQVVYRLSREPALLVLDNFEQLPDDAANVVARLANRVPRLRCLITSRRRLGLEGEREYPLAMLDTPEQQPKGSADPARLAQVPSVAMFVDRARAAKPTFRLTRQNAASVAELCARLDGWPLAIELAAPLLQTLPISAMLDRFDQHLDWRAGRRSGLPERQRTLRTTLEWSLSLLPEPVRAFLGRLRVMRGSFTVEDAQAVADETLAPLYLSHLHGCSLIERVDLGNSVGYQVRVPVREHLLDTAPADEAAALAERHARHFGDRALRVAPDVPMAEMTQRLLEWDQALPELRAAMAWFAEHDPVAGVAVAVRLSPLWELRGHAQEGLRWVGLLRGAAIGQGWQPTGHAALAEARLSSLVRPSGEVTPLLAEAVDLLAASDDRRTYLQALFYQIFNHLLRRDLAGLERCSARVQRVLNEGGPPAAQVVVDAVIAARALVLGDDEQALAGLSAAATLSAELGDLHGVVVHLTNLGLAAMAAERLDTAEAALAALDQGPIDHVNGYWAARATWLRARVALGRGDMAAAAAALAHASATVAGQQPTYGHEWALASAEVLAEVGDLPLSAQCLAAGERWHADQQQPFTLSHYERNRAILQKRYARDMDPEQQGAARTAAADWTMVDLARAMESLPERVAHHARSRVQKT